MKTVLAFATCVLGAVMAGGCTSSTAIGSGLPPCDGSLTVTVTNATTTPIFSWSPTCAANRLEVADAGGPPQSSGSFSAPAGGGAVWELAPSSGSFGPPVRFGTPPAGISDGGFIVQLIPGHVYTVSVERAGGEAIILSFGSSTFGH